MVDQSHQIQVKSRWGPESLGPDEAQVRTRVTRSRRGSGMDQSHQFQVKSRWGPESPDPGEAQVGTRVTRSR